MREVRIQVSDKSKDIRFWLMAIEHSASCLADRYALTLQDEFNSSRVLPTGFA